MSNSLDSTLTEAYELIEANRIDEAREKLTPLLDEYPDNPDLWWVYAHAVEDPAQARLALENVRRLGGDYPELDTLLDEVAEVEPATAPLGGIKRIRPLSSAGATPPDSLPELSADRDDFDIDDDFDDDFDILENEPEPSGRRNLAVIAAVVFSVLIIGAVILFALFGIGGDAPTPTQQVASNVTNDNTGSSGNTTDSSLGVPSIASEEVTEVVATTSVPATDTLEPTNTEVDSSPSPEPTETEATTEAVAQAVTTEEPTDTPVPPSDTPEPSPTIEPTASPEEQAMSLFTDFDVYEDEPFRTISSEDGSSTALVTICLGADDNRNEIVSSAMITLTELPSSIIETFDNVGITLYDCELERILRSISVSTEVVAEFASGELSERDFQLSWQPVE